MHQEEIEWALKTETIFKLIPHKAPDFLFLPVRKILRVRLAEIIPVETLLDLKQLAQ